MIAVMHLIDSLACAVIAWVCGAFLLSAHSGCARSIVVNLGLLLLAVGTVALAFLPSLDTPMSTWTLRAVKVGGAVVATGVYGHHFGWTTQARALLEWIAHCAEQIKARWRRLGRRTGRST